MSQILSLWNLLFLIPLVLSILFLIKNVVGAREDPNVELPERQGPTTARHEGASLDMNHAVEGRWEPRDETNPDVFPVHENSLHVLFQFLGAGKVPPTLTFPLFLLFWGISGWLLNQLLQPLGHEPWIFIWISIAGAFFFASFLSRCAAKWIGRQWLASRPSKMMHEELIGCEGEAAYKIDHEHGMAQVYDESGTIHRVNCRVEPRGSLIQEGDMIQIVGYDGDEDFYLVKQRPVESEPDVPESSHRH